MIDPRIILILLAIYGAYWTGHQAWRGIRWTGCGISKVLHIHECKKDIGPPVPIDEMEVEVQ